MKNKWKIAANKAGWNFDEPANEYRLSDTGNGYDAIDANKSWKELCIWHGIKVAQ